MDILKQFYNKRLSNVTYYCDSKMKDSWKGRKNHIWNNQDINWLHSVYCVIAFCVTESFLSRMGSVGDMRFWRRDPRNNSSDPQLHNNFWSFLLQKAETKLPSSLVDLRLFLNTLRKEFHLPPHTRFYHHPLPQFSSFCCIFSPMFQPHYSLSSQEDRFVLLHNC